MQRWEEPTDSFCPSIKTRTERDIERKRKRNRNRNRKRKRNRNRKRKKQKQKQKQKEKEKQKQKEKERIKNPFWSINADRNGQQFKICIQPKGIRSIRLKLKTMEPPNHPIPLQHICLTFVTSIEGPSSSWAPPNILVLTPACQRPPIPKRWNTNFVICFWFKI